MKRVMRKSILIGVAITLFGLFGMAANSSALTTLALPDPTQSYADPTNTLQGQHYVAFAHDDFWSFAARLIENNQQNGSPTYFPVGTYGNYNSSTGLGTLGTIIMDQAGSSNPGSIPNALREPSPAGTSFQGIWGWSGVSGDVASTGNMTVAQVLDILHAGSPLNNIPVFGLNMQVPNGASVEFVGQVYLVDPATGLKVSLDGVHTSWAFDDNPQGTGADTQGGAVRGSLDADFPGFSQIGDYNPNSPATAIPFSGGGHLDYLTYAPMMDLSNPAWASDYFVVDFTLGPGIDRAGNITNIGNEQVFLLGGVALPGTPVDVPEPATMLLLGFGLVGLAGVRRKFQK